MKKCSKCKVAKTLDDFYHRSDARDNRCSQCKACTIKRTREHQRTHLDEYAVYRKKYYEEFGRARAGNESMHKNKNCSLYIGVVVGERLCCHLFNDVQVMPFGNHNYDIICNKGKKIDVKTGCMLLQNGKNPRWKFHIDNNKIADYFILVAFDNLDKLTPLHIWMIPGNELNDKCSASITTSTICKWAQWERNIDEVQLCCMNMKTHAE